MKKNVLKAEAGDIGQWEGLGFNSQYWKKKNLQRSPFTRTCKPVKQNSTAPGPPTFIPVPSLPLGAVAGLSPLCVLVSFSWQSRASLMITRTPWLGELA